MKRLLAILCVAAAYLSVPMMADEPRVIEPVQVAKPNGEDAKAKPADPEVVKLFRGARPTPPIKIVNAIRAGTAGIHRPLAAPTQVIVVPKKLSMWGNSQYGMCVTSESMCSIASYSTFIGIDEIFVTEATAIAWARANGFLNGADLLEVIQAMQSSGIKDEKAILRKAGTPSSVKYSDEATLQSAIAQGQVSIAIDANALPSGAGNVNGWYAFGGRSYMNTDHCFTGDTKVSLLDGRELSFAELASGAAGDSFGVYSCDKDGNIVAGKAHSVRKTRENAELVKVTLDNGESVRCTKDHRFLMRDGTYKEASELQPEDSLMPLYRTVSKGGYELCYNPKIGPGKRGWRATHRIVAFGPGGRSGGMAAHHIDFNKRNNDPSNLRVMTPKDHATLHQRFSEKNRTQEHRDMARELMKKLWDDPEWAASQRAKLRASASARGKKTAKLGRSHWQTMSKEERLEISKKGADKTRGKKRSQESVRKGVQSLKDKIANDPEFAESLRLRAKKASEVAAKRPITDKQREARRKNAQRLKENKPLNHKVVSVEPCGNEDVYDLTVDEHHNFALTSGVFVHNCVGLLGYGPTTELFKALGVAVPSGAPTNGYLLFTWNTIGVVDHKWIMNTVVEAWVRNPTVTGLTPTPPNPPPPGKLVVTVANVVGGVGTPVKFTPTASGGTSPYLFLFDYGDSVQDAGGTHTYAKAGSYTVTVTAVDSVGSTGVGTCVATIGTAPIPPVPPTPTPGGQGTIIFNGTGTVLDGREFYLLDVKTGNMRLIDLLSPKTPAKETMHP